MKIVQYMDQFVPIYEDCMLRGVIERKPPNVDYEKLHSDPYGCKRQSDDPRCPSEELRVRLAIDNPEMVWLDSDVWIKSWPEMECKGKPYFIQSGKGIGEYIFYVNGCVDFFQSLLDEYQNHMIVKDNYWLLNAVNKRRGEVYIIPQYHFIHCTFSSIHLTKGGWDKIGGSGYEITNENNRAKLHIKE